jgi:replicative DNA helicase
MVQYFDVQKRSNPLSSNALGQKISGSRIPPHSIEAEEALLGAMLISKDAIADAVETVSESDFYKPSHGTIFATITKLYSQGQESDPVTVAEELKRMDLLESVGGASVLVRVQANTPAVSSAVQYAIIIKEYSMLRKLIGAASEIMEIGYSAPTDVEEALDNAEALIFSVVEHKGKDTLKWLYDLLGSSLERLEMLAERGEHITGVPTGYTDLDSCLSGLQPSNLIIVGARPAMGKTAFSLGLCANAGCMANKPVLLFSLEMSHMEIAQRMLGSEALVDASRLRNGQVHENDWKKLGDAVGRLGEAPIYIDDSPNVTLMDIRAKARRLAAKIDLGVIVIDYLQLMSGRRSAENRQVEVSEISRGLKILARELNVPVVALSQLSRTLEQRADKRPILADLRESGSLEQDADVVLFLYREEMYHPDTQDKGSAEVIVAKHRNGPTKTVRLVFRPQYARFDNAIKFDTESNY